VAYDREVRRIFGVRDPMVVLVRTGHPDGVFNPQTLAHVRGLTTALGQLPGMGPADVTSLATETGFRFRPKSIRRSLLLENLPKTPVAMADLRRDVRRIGLDEGLLVSRDGASTAIVLGVPADGDRQAFFQEVRKVASAHSAGHDRISVLGAPVAETLLGSHILADLGVPPKLLGEEGVEGSGRIGLIPFALVVMGLVFLIGFRRPAAALLPLAKVGVCLIIVFGLMGWLGVPVHLTTAVLPVILIAVGMTGEVHIFRRYAALQAERPEAGRAEWARATVEQVERPVLQAAAIAAVGFLSFSLSGLVPVRAFGLLAALGVALCLLWSLTVTPAVLSLAPPGWIVRRRADALEPANAFGRLAGWAARHRRAVLTVAGLAALLALDGVRRLAVQDSWVDGFAPESAFAREMHQFDEQFQGAHVLLVSVEAKPLLLTGEVEGEAVGDRRLAIPSGGLPAARLLGGFVELQGRGAAPAAWPGAAPRQWSSWVETASAEGDRLVLSWPLNGGSPKFWLDPAPGEHVGYEVRLEPFAVPATLGKVKGLESFLAARPGVGGVFGPAELLETAGFLMRPNDPASRRLPEDPGAAGILWRNTRTVLGEERLRRLVDDGYSRGLVTVFLKDSNYAATRRLMEEVRDHERELLAPHGLSVGFAGDVAVSQALIGAVVSAQVGSLGLSLLGIFAGTAWLLRSSRQGFYCVLPVTLAVLLSFAAMGWLGIPLGVATSMFASMTLGVGVDSTLHLLETIDRLRGQGLKRDAALSAALSATGPAILIDTLSTSLGFAVLLLSRVPANHRLGSLLSLSLLVGFAATLLIVPALLAGASGRRPHAVL
jgi:predicted RND superfamily exporter protein